MADRRSPFFHRKLPAPYKPPQDGHTGMGFSTMRHYEEVKRRMIKFAKKQDASDYGYYYDQNKKYEDDYYVEDMYYDDYRDAAPAKKQQPQFLMVPHKHDYHHGKLSPSPGHIRRHKSPAPVSPSPNRKRDQSKKR